MVASPVLGCHQVFTPWPIVCHCRRPGGCEQVAAEIAKEHGSRRHRIAARETG